jgi:nucleoside-diphosphate-sugar epimerase
MRVFVTGASGHIGSAVVPEIVGAGHEVIGLARSDRAAAALEAAGCDVARGDLADPDGIAEAAADADGVIHLAFQHESIREGDFEGAVATDLRAIDAIGEALAGDDKPFVTTSGTLMLGQAGISQRPGREDDVIDGGPRVDAENATIAFADRGVRSSVVRLPPLVHSTLDAHGFGPTLIRIARDSGVAGYVGAGTNRWPAVHTLDAARVYRLALERAPAGTRLHAVGDLGIRFREIAEAIAARLGIPAQSIPSDEADAHFAFLAGLVGLDNPVSNDRTRELLDWTPSEPGLIEDLDAGHYFDRP